MTNADKKQAEEFAQLLSAFLREVEACSSTNSRRLDAIDRYSVSKLAGDNLFLAREHLRMAADALGAAVHDQSRFLMAITHNGKED